MKKLAKDLVKGDVIKLEFGCAAFPTYHEVFSTYKDGDQLRVTVKMPYGTEPIDFDENEMVEVRE